MTKCEAHAQSDQMRCERCDLLWDTNDPDKPQCKTAHNIEVNKIRVLMNGQRQATMMKVL